MREKFLFHVYAFLSVTYQPRPGPQRTGASGRSEAKCWTLLCAGGRSGTPLFIYQAVFHTVYFPCNIVIMHKNQPFSNQIIADNCAYFTNLIFSRYSSCKRPFLLIIVLIKNLLQLTALHQNPELHSASWISRSAANKYSSVRVTLQYPDPCTTYKTALLSEDNRFS